MTEVIAGGPGGAILVPMRVGLAAVVLAVTMGLAVGIGAYTFVYAKGAAYLTNDPRACVNCHVMREQFDGWTASSHRAVAVCNDCHAPHDLVGKYATKARNGLFHSIAFTSGNFPDPLRIKPLNLRIAEDNCRRCHSELVLEIEHHAGTSGSERLECTRCHDEVGHPLR